jgi:hypothetical protein
MSASFSRRAAFACLLMAGCGGAGTFEKPKEMTPEEVQDLSKKVIADRLAEIDRDPKLSPAEKAAEKKLFQATFGS